LINQREISSEQSLLNEKGGLIQTGWARSPLWIYNRSAIRGVFTRIVEVDRYILFSDMAVLVFEIANRGRMIYASVQISNMVQGATFYDAYRLNTPIGMVDLPPSCGSGTVKIRQKNCTIDFSVMTGGSRLIKVDLPTFYGGTGLRGVVVLTPVSVNEYIATVHPWRRDRRAFRYNLRNPAFKAEGVMQFGTDELVFSKDNGWAALDWSRGYYPHGEVHYLAVASGVSGSRQIGCCIGYGMEDNSSGTENAFFIDGTLYKLGQVTFRISPRDWLAPWYFSSDDKRLSMEFQPVLEYRIKHSLLFQSIKERRVFGYMSGTYIEESGTTCSFHNLPGYTERQKMKL
jgi:hypothetical protein